MTNSLTSNERDQQLKQIRERQAQCARPDRDDVPQRAADPLARALSRELRQTQVDRAFLLSLLDSQAAGGERDFDWALRELADGWITNNEREGPHGFYQNARRVLGFVATDATASMRTACIDAIKSLRATPHGAAYNNAINDAIRKVESIQVEQEKQ